MTPARKTGAGAGPVADQPAGAGAGLRLADPGETPDDTADTADTAARGGYGPPPAPPAADSGEWVYDPETGAILGDLGACRRDLAEHCPL